MYSFFKYCTIVVSNIYLRKTPSYSAKMRRLESFLECSARHNVYTNLNKGGQTDHLADFHHIFNVKIRQNSSNQKNGIGTFGSGIVDLPCINHKFFAQERALHMFPTFRSTIHIPIYKIMIK